MFYMEQEGAEKNTPVKRVNLSFLYHMFQGIVGDKHLWNFRNKRDILCLYQLRTLLLLSAEELSRLPSIEIEARIKNGKY